MLESRAMKEMKLVVPVLAVLMTSRGPVRASTDRCPGPTDLPSTSAVRAFRDICYQFVGEERYWTAARDYCIQYGGRLVKINDAETNEFIVTSLNGLWWRNNGVWIGLHDRHSELRWQWSANTRYTNEPATWFNWARGHPRAFMHRFRDCVRMGRNHGRWLWHETPCSALNWKYRFICQYEMAPPKTSPTTELPTPSTVAFGVVPGQLEHDGQPDADDRRGDRTSLVPSTTSSPLTTSSFSVPRTTTDTAENDAFYEYILARSSGDDDAEQRKPINSKWVIVAVCCITSCLVLLAIVLLWRRRVDRRLRLVAVAMEECVEEEMGKDFKTVFPSSRSDKVPGLLREDKPRCTKSNHYGPEPRAPIKDTTEGLLKNSETPEYCPMNGTETSDYLQPRPDQPGSGYVPMGPPPDYDDACVLPHPPVAYANTENGEPNTESTCEKDCSVLGYDVLPPMNVYSEISEEVGNDNSVDNEGNHIYESLDQA